MLHKNHSNKRNTKGKKKYQKPVAKLIDVSLGVWGGTCGTCLSSLTEIATPYGDINIKDIKINQQVWTLDEKGRRVSMPVVKISKTAVFNHHKVIRLTLVDGRELWVSPDHPTINQKRICQLGKRQKYDCSVVLDVQLVDYWDKYTYDLLPAGDRGYYWANNILIGSTLNYAIPEEDPSFLIKRAFSSVEFL